MKNLDIDEAFENYFYKSEGFGFRSERFYSDLETNLPADKRYAIAKAWLKAAYLEGAKTMAKDTLETLGDYATSMSGISVVRYTVTEAFDIAAVDLKCYYDQVLKDE